MEIMNLATPRGHLALTSTKLIESAECAFACEGLTMGPSNLRPALESLSTEQSLDYIISSSLCLCTLPH